MSGTAPGKVTVKVNKLPYHATVDSKTNAKGQPPKQATQQGSADGQRRERLRQPGEQRRPPDLQVHLYP
jgi:hypothetical protein